MNVIGLALLLLAGPVQEDLDSDLERVAPRIVTQGVGAQMAELLKTDAGRLVVKEKIAALVGKAIERIDRDPQGCFERYLFTEDADGMLRVRPDRQHEMDLLGREIQRRAKDWESFRKAADEVAGKIPDKEPLGRKIKEYWGNPEFLLALYQRVDVESRVPDAEELWNRLIGRSLFRGNDGKLRLRGNYKDETVAAIAEVKGEAEELAGVEEQVKQFLAKAKGDERPLCASPEGRVLIARHLKEFAGEGVEDPVAKLGESERKADLDEIAALAALAAEIRPLLDRVAKNLAQESEHDRDLRTLLQDPGAVVLLVAKMKTMLAERQANRDAAIAGSRDDFFDSDEGGRITLKKGRFLDAKGQDSVETVVTECDGILSEAAATRATLDELAERALDPTICSLLQSREGASGFTELQTRVLEDLKQAERDGGVAKFVQIYFEKAGDRFIVRPERSKRVEEMTARTREVQKALDLASREEVPK